jgi:ornithine--oxo-acid transaminase
MKNSSIERENLYCAHNYEPSPVVLTRGEGVYAWDDAGIKYIDMMSAYSAVSHGHCHPRIVGALIRQAQTLNVVSRSFYTDKLGIFLERLCTLTGYDKALPMNTGVEAVETALKAARKWAYTNKNVPLDQVEIIACHGNFHGRTLAAISMSTVKQYREGFGPLTPGFKIVSFGDVEALEKAITPNTAAFIVEPIQGEGGIKLPPVGYLKACERLCKKHNVLLICDEVQTGLGRTGKLLASQHEDVIPDGLILGKALGGGVIPLSAFLCNAEIMSVFTPGDHGSTFGGNPLAAVVGLEALNVLLDESLIQRAATAGEYFMKKLKQLSSPMIKEVRGRGLLIGIEFHADHNAYDVCMALLSYGVLTKDTHRTIIRFAPPLMVTEADIDKTVAALQAVLSAIEGGK